MRDVIIIGGGHNGLVAPALLAKAGLARLTPIACCDGCQCRSPTSRTNGSRANRCARRSRLEEPSVPGSVRDRAVAQRCSCGLPPGTVIRLRLDGPFAGAWAR